MVVALDEVAHNAGFYARHFDEFLAIDCVIEVELSAKGVRKIMLCERRNVRQEFTVPRVWRLGMEFMFMADVTVQTDSGTGFRRQIRRTGFTPHFIPMTISQCDSW